MTSRWVCWPELYSMSSHFFNKTVQNSPIHFFFFTLHSSYHHFRCTQEDNLHGEFHKTCFYTNHKKHTYFQIHICLHMESSKIQLGCFLNRKDIFILGIVCSHPIFWDLRISYYFLVQNASEYLRRRILTLILWRFVVMFSAGKAGELAGYKGCL